MRENELNRDELGYLAILTALLTLLVVTVANIVLLLALGY